MRNVLVTGGAGFIGSHIVEALVARGDRVRVVDNLLTGKLENLESVISEVEFVEGDLTRPADAAAAVRGMEFVIHQAALPSVPLSVEAPRDTNAHCVDATVALLEAASAEGVRRLVYAGSSSCYGDQPYSSKRETDHPSPLSPYAAAKLAAEMYCQAFYHSFGLETVTIRYFNVFGPRQDPNSPYSAVIPRFITALLAGDQPTIYGDGTQSRDFTYVENVVHGNLLALEAAGAAGRTFNVANGVSTDLLTLLRLLGEMLELKVDPVFEPARAGDVKESLADITQARAVLEYEPPVSFEEGLRRSIAYYRNLCETAAS